MVRPLRSLTVWFLALWNGLDLKQVGARLGMDGKRVSRILRRTRIDDSQYEPLLAAVTRRPAEVQVVRRCLEGLAGLDEAGDLTDAEQEEIERGVREAERFLRSVFTEAARQSRHLPPFDGYPRPEHLEAARWHAETLWTLLAEMTELQRLAVVRLCREGQTWWLMERVARASVEETSRDLERAASLARLAVEIAERVQGPTGWCRRVRGYAMAHSPNVLRVTGELLEARTGLEPAKQLWESGEDPTGVLDPGRLLDLEASLCRAERDFDRSLALLDQAFPVSHNPGRVLVIKGAVFEVMGDDAGAIETLRRALPLVESQGDARLLYMARFNLAVAFTRVGRYRDAAALVRQVREAAGERGDDHETSRILWLEGRIAAGLGRPVEARALLELAAEQFAAREMWYDVALARQEIAGLLLQEGRAEAARELAWELAETFKDKGVHPEARAALRLFHAAAEREEATPELARDIVGWLMRARHDPDLRFTGSSVPGTTVGVHDATRFDRSLRSAGAAPAVGVHDAAFLGDLPTQEVSEEGLEEAGRSGGGQEGGGESGGEQDIAHEAVSGAAPAASLHDSGGPRLPAIFRRKREKNHLAVPVDRPLTLRQRLARLFRTLTGLSQSEFGAKTGIHPLLLHRYEQGRVEPSPEHGDRLAGGADLTVEAGKEILSFADSLRRPRQRSGLGRAELHRAAGSLVQRVAERLLRLPPGGPPPKAEDREHAAELWARLQNLPEGEQLAVVRVGREYQSWALAEICCTESVNVVSKQLDRAAGLARLAREIAERVHGPESWRLCLIGYAAAHLPNVQRVQGDLAAAREGLEEAKQLFLAGSNPGGLLDPGRLLDLEASLCRAERNFEKAVALLDEALPLSHNPGRVLLTKGGTLLVMGAYERALATFLKAAPLVKRQGDPRQEYMLLFNTAVAYTHLGRFAEAGALVGRVSEKVEERGDEHEACRVLWLRGRIAAGLGRPLEAQRLLAEARREFAARGLWYDVALADLEIAPFLLAEGSTAEVKALATELVEAFESRGVHSEALKALRLFQEAAEREEATGELAGRVLRYLFEAQHQPGLPFAA